MKPSPTRPRSEVRALALAALLSALPMAAQPAPDALDTSPRAANPAEPSSASRSAEPTRIRPIASHGPSPENPRVAGYVADHPGFKSRQEINLKRHLAAFAAKGGYGKTFNLDADTSMFLSPPGISGDLMLLGTTLWGEPDGLGRAPRPTQNFLIAVDLERLRASAGNPVLSIQAVLAPVLSVQPMPQEGRFLVMMDQGFAQVYQVTRESSGREAGIHVQGLACDTGINRIRQATYLRDGSARIAVVGDDPNVKLFEWNQNRPLAVGQQQILPASLSPNETNLNFGSVHASAFHDQILRITEDTGKLILHDLRSGPDGSLVFDTGKPGPYDSAAYDPNHVVVGYHDGCIQQFDLRKLGETTFAKDPFVHCVSQVELTPDNQTMLVSGRGGFSVYREQAGTWRLWAHQELAGATSASILMRMPVQSAQFSGPDEVLNVNSLGTVSLYQLVAIGDWHGAASSR